MKEVSVIVPAYNSGEFICDAIDSVLRQTFNDLEVVVVDDGSSDNTARLVQQYGQKVRYIHQENQGVSAARNRGLAESTGRYVAFLDADDTWLPDKLELQIARLGQDPSVRATDTCYVVGDRQLNPLAVTCIKRSSSTIEDLLLRGTTVFVSSVLCERALFEVSGGFDTGLSQCADWDMWIRLALHTEFAVVEKPLVTYRQHASNMSRNVKLLERDSARVLDKAFLMPELPSTLKSKSNMSKARNYMVIAGSYFRAGRYPDFIRCAAKAVSLDASQFNYLLSYPSRVASRARI